MSDTVNAADADQIIRDHLAKQRITDARKAKMDPNRGSEVGVYDYAFNMSARVNGIGAGLPSTVLSKQPSQPFHPETLCTNAPCVGFWYLTQGSVGNAEWMLGDGDCDAFLWAPTRQDRRLNLPPMSTSTTMKVTFYTSGLVPSQFAPEQAFTLSMQFEGPALQR